MECRAQALLMIRSRTWPGGGGSKFWHFHGALVVGTTEQPKSAIFSGMPAFHNPAEDLARERESFIDNLLVRFHLIIEMSRPALRQGSLNSLFQVAVYLPS